MRSPSPPAHAHGTTLAPPATADPRPRHHVIATTSASTVAAAPAPTGVLVTVLAAELVTAAAVIATSTGLPAPTPTDLALTAYLAGLGIAATTIAIHSPPGVDLSPVWTAPAALLLHPALTAALVVVLHTHQSRHPHRSGSSPRWRLVGSAAAVLACITARTAYTLAGGHLTGGAAVVAAVSCFVVIHGLVLTATATPGAATPGAATPDAAGRDEHLLTVATSSLGGLTAAALALHPLLVLSVLPAACCLHRAVLARHLEHLGRLDLKIGLLNAAAWHHQAQQALLQPDTTHRPCAVLVLDRFKHVNDTRGHLAGDAVLVAVADTLRAEVRDRDLVGRFGGDEFAILLTAHRGQHGERHDKAGLRAVAERICRRVAALQVEAPTPHSATIITGISVSIGGVCIDTSNPDHSNPDHQPDMHALVDLADRALYDAKHTARGTVGIARPTGPTRHTRQVSATASSPTVLAFDPGQEALDEDTRRGCERPNDPSDRNPRSPALRRRRGRAARQRRPRRGAASQRTKVEVRDMQGDLAQYAGDGAGEFELDMTIVEFGPVAAALLGNTDDGCDTRKDGDC